MFWQCKYFIDIARTYIFYILYKFLLTAYMYPTISLLHLLLIHDVVGLPHVLLKGFFTIWFCHNITYTEFQLKWKFLLGGYFLCLLQYGSLVKCLCGDLSHALPVIDLGQRILYGYHHHHAFLALGFGICSLNAWVKSAVIAAFAQQMCEVKRALVYLLPLNNTHYAVFQILPAVQHGIRTAATEQSR